MLVCLLIMFFLICLKVFMVLMFDLERCIVLFVVCIVWLFKMFLVIFSVDVVMVLLILSIVIE